MNGTWAGSQREWRWKWRGAVDMEACPPEFDYNPSSWRQRAPICLLAGIGALIAAWMSLYQFGLIGGVWDPVFGEGTQRVLDSDVAQRMDAWLRVPDAAFGAWGYLSEAVLGLVGGTRRWQHRPWMVLLFGIDVIPLGGVSGVLVAMQGFVVGHWCSPCLVTALISFVLVYLAYDEVWASIKYLWRVWKHYRDWGLLWRTFWGRASEEAERVAMLKE